MFDAICWIDDETTNPPPGTDFDRPGLDGITYKLSFAATLEDEANDLLGALEHGHRGENDYYRAINPVIADALRELAGRVRAAGCRTPEAWIEHQALVNRRVRVRRHR